jgi:hypothetical protein
MSDITDTGERVEGASGLPSTTSTSMWSCRTSNTGSVLGFLPHWERRPRLVPNRSKKPYKHNGELLKLHSVHSTPLRHPAAQIA